MIGNWPEEHMLTMRRLQSIADQVKFISDYERQHKVKLKRERQEVLDRLWAFTCDAPDTPGFDGVKYSEKHHKHTDAARSVIEEIGSRSRRRIPGLRHEHVVPRSLIEKMIFSDSNAIEGMKEGVAHILKKYLKVAVVTKEEARLLDSSGFKTKMPEDWDREDPYARYKKVGIMLNNPV
jgi:hypothetical protein